MRSRAGGDAPPTILNQRTSRTRRFATQVYETQRLRAIATASRGTLNDVVMTICGAALRRYLLELNELPDKSLVAFMPVNIRDAGDEGGGNKVAVLLAAMGTDVADPVQRLESVIASTSATKGQMKGMGQLPALAYSGYLLAPGIAQTVAAMLGVRNLLPTTFNLILSNVPGPRHKLYLLGSELEAVYPISIPAHGMALNITLETYAEKMCFGFTGDRDALPSLQKLAVYTGDALAEFDRPRPAWRSDAWHRLGTQEASAQFEGNARGFGAQTAEGLAGQASAAEDLGGHQMQDADLRGRKDSERRPPKAAATRNIEPSPRRNEFLIPAPPAHAV